MNPQEIKDLRLEKKLTQAELGHLCGGVKKSGVSAWENGKRKPSGAALKILEELRDGEIVITELSDLEVKLLDQNVQVGGFEDREDYLTKSLKHLLQHGKFLSLYGKETPTPLQKPHPANIVDPAEEAERKKNENGGENKQDSA